MKIVICSGYFDPIHIGHIEYIKRSKKKGDRLVVIVNNDGQALLKKGFSFQSEDDRLQIMSSIESVDEAILSIDEDKTVCKTIEQIYKEYNEKWEKPSFIFAKGGDQTKDIIPEKSVCDSLGIEIVDKIVGQLNSSTNILEKYSGKVAQKPV